MDEQRLGVAKLTKIIKDIEAGCWRYSYFARLALDLRDARSRIATLERDLAAAQAEVVAARAAMADDVRVCCGPAGCGKAEPCPIAFCLSKPLGSLSALEAWATEFGLKVAQVAASRGYQEGRAFRPEKVDMPAIVREELSRILGKEAARG